MRKEYIASVCKPQGKTASGVRRCRWDSNAAVGIQVWSFVQARDSLGFNDELLGTRK